MAGRLLGLSFLAAVGFLLLFSTGGHVSAITFKETYSTNLSCEGPLPPATLDSCVPAAAPVGARKEGLTADIITHFIVPDPSPKPLYSNYQYLSTMGTPANWKLATDKEIPDGAAVGTLVSETHLGLFGGACGNLLVLQFIMFDCTTDNSPSNLIAWDTPLNGRNLIAGKAGGVPNGCAKYPTHLDVAVNSVKPRARYMGAIIVSDGSAPSQLQFAMFNPDQLSALPNPPESGMKDDFGYINRVILNNPAVPAPVGDSLDEFCTPLATTTTLWGKTGGQGGLIADYPPYPTSAVPFWKVADDCDGIDNDADTKVDEMCGIQRAKNPAAGKGYLGTNSHLAGNYSESYRDADGDTIPNVEDECPFQVDTCRNNLDDDTDSTVNDGCPAFGAAETTCGGTCTDSDGVAPWDTCDEDGDDMINDGCAAVGTAEGDPDGDFLDNVCDPNDTVPSPIVTPPGGVGGRDEDGDGWRNQPDNCPLVSQTDQADADKDYIGDACDTLGAFGIGLGPNAADGYYLNVQELGAVCISPTAGGAAGLDTDNDGWCDATEDLIPPTGAEKLSDKALASSVPEYKGLDYALTALAGTGSPGAAARTCDNYAYYGTGGTGAHKGLGGEVDDDGDTKVNTTTPEPNCVLTMAGDTEPPSGGGPDGVPDATDNCPTVWNPTQLNTDGDATGDACDTDDDNDKLSDVFEWGSSTDAKNVCDPRNFDIDGNGKINGLDTGAFNLAIKPMGSPPSDRLCSPPANYNVCR